MEPMLLLKPQQTADLRLLEVLLAKRGRDCATPTVVTQVRDLLQFNSRC
jgi:hypothetical protein